MKITAISDLHGEFPELPGGDLLIIAGDCTSDDRVRAWKHFFDWLEKQEYTNKVMIAGNHDRFCEQWATSDDPIHDMLDDDPPISYLCDSGIEIAGVKIWGSPYSLYLDGMNPCCAAFTGREQEIAMSFNMIPNDVDILVTHTPPWGILDQVNDYHNGKIRNCGSRSLLRTLERIKPRFHFFGHIHEKGGGIINYKRPGHGIENNTTCINVSLMNEHYQLTHEPITVEYALD